MNVHNLEVFHAQIAHKDRSIAQLLQMEANIDLAEKETKIQFYNVDNKGVRSESPTPPSPSGTKASRHGKLNGNA